MSESSRPILSDPAVLDSLCRMLCSSQGTIDASDSLVGKSNSKSSDLFGLSSGSISALVAAGMDFGLWREPKTRRGNRPSSGERRARSRQSKSTAGDVVALTKSTVGDTVATETFGPASPDIIIDPSYVLHGSFWWFVSTHTPFEQVLMECPLNRIIPSQDLFATRFCLLSNFWDCVCIV
jgi:hypothetical protein